MSIYIDPKTHKAAYLIAIAGTVICGALAVYHWATGKPLPDGLLTVLGVSAGALGFGVQPDKRSDDSDGASRKQDVPHDSE